MVNMSVSCALSQRRRPEKLMQMGPEKIFCPGLIRSPSNTAVTTNSPSVERGLTLYIAIAHESAPYMKPYNAEFGGGDLC